MLTKRTGKVLIIDDSILVRNYLTKMITLAPNLELCSASSSGQNGFRQILLYKPDIVILDLEMENGDGLYVLNEITRQIPAGDHPFVIIHSSRAKHGDPLFKEAIQFGFCDFILKIEADQDTLMQKLKQAFLPKINAGLEAKANRSLLYNKNISQASSFTPNSGEILQNSSVPAAVGLNGLATVLNKRKSFNPNIIIIGASTGGPQAVREMLTNLSRPISVPIVVIQHMPETFTYSFAQELAAASGLPAFELKHNMRLENGKIYVFPGGHHGKISMFGTFFVYYADKQEYANHPFKPSINLAVQNLLGGYYGHALYCILSGMGKDGVIGARQLKEKSSLIIAQDEQSSAVWGMPGGVVKENLADIVLPMNELNKGLKLILDTYGI
ncbi:MAG: chemotaxis protein CheB [Brevinema sp.]